MTNYDGQLEVISLERLRICIKNLSHGNQSLAKDLNWGFSECETRGAIMWLGCLVCGS